MSVPFGLPSCGSAILSAGATAEAAAAKSERAEPRWVSQAARHRGALAEAVLGLWGLARARVPVCVRRPESL